VEGPDDIPLALPYVKSMGGRNICIVQSCLRRSDAGLNALSSKS